jgi:uncharacterized protein (TIGR02452 family)
MLDRVANAVSPKGRAHVNACTFGASLDKDEEVNREQRAALGRETLAILQSGTFVLANGRAVSIVRELDFAKSYTEVMRPQELEAIAVAFARGQSASPTNKDGAAISVANESTFAGVRYFHGQGVDPKRVMCLNFASAKNPGGGFLSGSQAQEESLARSSGLVACQDQASEFYSFHRSQRNLLYSDHLVYSPSVPVFRSDDDALLTDPYCVSMVTMAAPNAKAVRAQQVHDVGRIQSTFEQRIRLLLAFCWSRQYTHLVLGAWGCGVFGHQPLDVASAFRSHLLTDFNAAFAAVRFSVLSNTSANISEFQTVFGAK